MVGKKPGRLAGRNLLVEGGGAITCTFAEEFQPRVVEEFQPGISKKEKKDSGRHFGWPFWPMQAGPGWPPHPGEEEAAAGQELWGGAAPTVVVAAVNRSARPS